MKRTMFGALTTLVLALVINVPLAQAQSKTKADVPFEFEVAAKMMPAGTYTISEMTDIVTRVRNERTNASVLVIAQREESLKPQSPRLVFRKYGDQYFLAEAWNGSGSAAIEFPVGQHEKELRIASNDAPAPQEVVIAMR